MKLASEIVKWGVVKPFFDKNYSFNFIDIETFNNELFIFGRITNGIYSYSLDNFYEEFHSFLLECIRSKRDVLTWTRYDNTHLLKLILSKCDKKSVNKILLRVGKITPIYEYVWCNYQITLVNIIKDSMIIKFDDGVSKARQVTLYNLKNLYQDRLEQVAESYHIDYYSKLGEEYHIIDKKRFYADLEYQNGVLKSNELDNKVIIDIAKIMLENFKSITGNYPKSIFTAGSIARSYLLSYKELDVRELNFKMMFGNNNLSTELLDYSMRAYHGGKIESYALGYIGKAKIIDIAAAYPFAFSKLPKMKDSVWKFQGRQHLDLFFYAWIRCDIYIENDKLIHPIVVINPVNNTNISPCGWCENVVITKVEYDYLVKHNVEIHVYDYIGIEDDRDIFPYKNIVNGLFNSRLNVKESNPALSDMLKTIINSLYGITFELTDVYIEDDEVIKWLGYRAGDYFNPILASYITAMTRTYLSEVSYDIVKNGGEVFLNMTDSIIYRGQVTLPVISEEKTLGMFETPKEIDKVLILGAGRYEYLDTFKNKYTIKNRGFSVSVKNTSFYNMLELKEEMIIKHKTFVSSFKATTNKFSSDMLGHLIEDEYKIKPFNLGGKRIIENRNVNLNKEYTRTLDLKSETGIIKVTLD